MSRPGQNPRGAGMDALREAALDHLGEEPAPAAEGAPRRPRPVEPAVAALFPAGAVVIHDLIAAAARTWRDATDREAPSLERLSAPGVISRIDADAASGYLAVVTADETWRAFLPREQLTVIAALLLRRPIEQVARELGAGPARLAP